LKIIFIQWQFFSIQMQPPSKFMFLVKDWCPMSEHGGLIAVVAESKEECIKLLYRGDGFDHKIKEKVDNSVVRKLANSSQKSEIIMSFLTP
jgi:hypothetical protein